MQEIRRETCQILSHGDLPHSASKCINIQSFVTQNNDTTIYGHV